MRSACGTRSWPPPRATSRAVEFACRGRWAAPVGVTSVRHPRGCEATGVVFSSVPLIVVHPGGVHARVRAWACGGGSRTRSVCAAPDRWAMHPFCSGGLRPNGCIAPQRVVCDRTGGVHVSPGGACRRLARGLDLLTIRRSACRLDACRPGARAACHATPGLERERAVAVALGSQAHRECAQKPRKT